MKSLRLFAAALLACTYAASAAHACDAHKSAKGASTTAATAASASKTSGTATAAVTAENTAAKKSTAKSAGAGCTAEMAAACTPAMRAACESNAAVAAAMGCESKSTTAVAASSTKGKTATKIGDCCAMKSTKASTASVAAASPKSATTDHCADVKSTTATMAAGTPAAGMKCFAHNHAVAHDCSACEDWMASEQEVRALGASAQVVALKNGAMIVYTATTPGEVKALQNVIAKRHEKMLGALAGTSGKTLCAECKSLRGAIASGKLHREVVNVERGCMTLITSSDREVVSKIRTMTDPQMAVR